MFQNFTGNYKIILILRFWFLLKQYNLVVLIILLSIFVSIFRKMIAMHTQSHLFV